MKSAQNGKWVAGLLMVILLSPTAAATELYRWVDANGVTHFSQMPPELSVAGVSQQILRDSRPSGYDPEQDIYGVEIQAERMRQLREKRKEQRQARLDREREAQKQQVVQYRDRGYYRYPVYRPGWGNPWPPSRPTPPVTRPPGVLLPLPPVARPPSLASILE